MFKNLFESVDVDDIFDENDEEITIKEEILTDYLQETYSDSDQEGEYSDGEDQPVGKKIKSDYYIGRDKITEWKKTYKSCTPFSETEITTFGVAECGSYATTVLETWELFFPEEMLNLIVENTNKYISGISSHSSRERDARPIDIIELKALIGLLYMSGLLRSSRLNVNELWDQNGFGVERFWLTMSKHRFLFLMRCVHFADQKINDQSNGPEGLGDIKEVMDIFVNRCQVMYNPSECVTIGEMLISFRGSCPFKQYVPSKSKRYGIKLFALVDSKMPYTKNLEIDVGQEPEGQYRIGVPHAQDVVERLINPISGTSRNVTCDKRFTSFELISSLLKNHQLTSVCGVRKTKSELPKQFVNARTRSPHSTLYAYGEDVTILSYIPEKDKCIVVASTMNNTNDIHLSSKTPIHEPELISFYNATRTSVNTIEQYCSTYDVSRFTKRWPMIIFFSFLNIGAINSYLIYLQNNSGDNLFRRSYLKQLAIALTQDHLKRRAMQKNVPPEVRQRRKEVAGIVDDEPKGDPSNPNVRKKCFQCQNRSKTRFFCKYCGKFVCLKHAQFLCENCV